MICYETICKEFAERFEAPGSAIELWIGRQDGRPFSVLIYDKRDAGPGHMHFGVWDIESLWPGMLSGGNEVR